jgi:hypothetical protein
MPSLVTETRRGGRFQLKGLKAGHVYALAAYIPGYAETWQGHGTRANVAMVPQLSPQAGHLIPTDLLFTMPSHSLQGQDITVSKKAFWVQVDYPNKKSRPRVFPAGKGPNGKYVIAPGLQTEDTETIFVGLEPGKAYIVTNDATAQVLVPTRPRRSIAGIELGAVSKEMWRNGYGPPIVIEKVRIAGTPRVGDILTAEYSPATDVTKPNWVSALPTATLDYVWLVKGKRVGSGPTLKVSDKWIGEQMHLTILVTVPEPPAGAKYWAGVQVTRAALPSGVITR